MPIRSAPQASLFIAILLVPLLFRASVVLAKEGDLAPDFALPDMLSQQMVRLADHRGKVILLDFWASWCGPCRASFPAYEALRQDIHARFGADNFEIFAVNVDMEKHQALEFLKRQSVNFIILDENTGGATQQKYQLLAMPTSFLIGPEGIIHVQHSGFNSAYVELMRRKIELLIETKLQP